MFTKTLNILKISKTHHQPMPEKTDKKIKQNKFWFVTNVNKKKSDLNVLSVRDVVVECFRVVFIHKKKFICLCDFSAICCLFVERVKCCFA